jgi:ectoine hydroxylase-related dioxygenase (phytanoyl-CoA dioxygenase family)
MGGLNSEQIAFYKDQGYLLVEDVVPVEDLQPLISELNETVDQNAREAQAEGQLSELFEDEPFERRLARMVESVADPSDTSFSDTFFEGLHGKLKTEGMFAVQTHPAILDIVESLIGPEILAHPQFNIRPKLPNQDTSVVPWHQDLGYLQPDASETFMVNFWIPLVDATVENGCMEVIAGSHKAPLINHVLGLGPGRNFKGIVDEALPDGEQVQCPVPLGGVLLIQHKTIHRSVPNHSDHIRWSMDIRYSDPRMPTGRDGVPGFIARSKAEPASVANTLADWLRLFESV